MIIEVWAFVLSLVGVLLAGAVAGFFISRWYFKKQLEKNPPINEKMIRVMLTQMGQKPSESRVRAIMNAMKKNQ